MRTIRLGFIGVGMSTSKNVNGILDLIAVFFIVLIAAFLVGGIILGLIFSVEARLGFGVAALIGFIAWRVAGWMIENDY